MVELHTIIVWESGFKEMSKILWTLQSKFNFVYAQKSHCKIEDMPKLLTKIYPNRDFDSKSPKMDSIGGENFYFFVVKDRNPNIKNGVNKNSYIIKNDFRKSSGLNCFHISDDEEEAYHNFIAIKKDTKYNFKKFSQFKTKIYIYNYDKELVSYDPQRFKTVKDVFKVLNKFEKWVILRNWEEIEKDLVSEEHGDIDILCSDFYRTLTVLNAVPIFENKSRVYNHVIINNKHIPFDIRYVGDNYMDKKWEKNIIESREFDKKGEFYIPSTDNYFWMLLYHVVFHKRKVSDDYKNKLQNNIAKNIDFEDIKSFKRCEKLIKIFLNKNKYKVTTPVDESVKVTKNPSNNYGEKVGWMFKLIISVITRKRNDDLSSIKKLRSLDNDLRKCKILKKDLFATENYIIKTANERNQFLLKNEMKILQKLDKYDYFPNFVDYFDYKNKGYLVMTRIKGRDIANDLTLSPKKRSILKRDWKKIKNILRENKINHRDVRPENLIMSDNRLYLIDFQFSIINGKDIIYSNLNEEALLRACEKNLGGVWKNPKSNIDDDYSMNQIIKYYTKQKKIKEYLQFIKKKVKRYAYYK